MQGKRGSGRSRHVDPPRGLSNLIRLRRIATGSVETLVPGLVTGWMTCPLCRVLGPGKLRLSIDGRRSDTTAAVCRPDVPGSAGFAQPIQFRLPERSWVHVRVRCRHGFSIRRRLWMSSDVGGIAEIEQVSEGMVSGWVSTLGTSDYSPTTVSIVFDDGSREQTLAHRRRPEVEPFLGGLPVFSFNLDLGDQSGSGPAAGAAELRVLTIEGERPTARWSSSPIVVASHVDQDYPHPQVDSSLSALAATRAAGLAGSALALSQDPELDSMRAWLVSHGVSHDVASTYTYIAGLRKRAPGALAIVPNHMTAQQELATGMGLSALETAHAWVFFGTVPAREREIQEVRHHFSGWVPTLRSAPEAVASSSKSPSTEGHSLAGSICVAGLVDHPSGIGSNASRSVDALRPFANHLCRFTLRPSDEMTRAARRRAGRWSDLRDHTTLLHYPIDQVAFGLESAPDLLSSGRLIGYFMWETSSIPERLRPSLNLVDEIWTGSAFVAESIRRATERPCRVAGHAIDVARVQEVSREELGLSDTQFLVHFSFDANSTAERKNPSAAIAAFQRAFPDDQDAALLLKIRNFTQFEWLARRGSPSACGTLAAAASDGRIRLWTEECDYDVTLGMMQASDCYLSLHRAEGFGYTMAEAMALGVPVVATGYSGNLDFMTHDEAWLVPFDERPVGPDEYFYWDPAARWAEPDVATAADFLREVREGAQIVTQKVRRAKRRAMSELSVSALSARYQQLLEG